MAKAKKRGNFADRLNQTKSSAGKLKKKLNPFEVHVNKEKFTILGRQLKHDKGMPGVSRGKALKRRNETLGKEYMNKNKTNKFKDHRFDDSSMSKEQAASVRFVAEQLNRFKQNTKHSRYNLNDDVALTHKGQTLEEIEQFRDAVTDDDTDDDEKLGKLDEEYTGAAHFGGGGDDEQNDGTSKSRKDMIEDLIAEQKRRKIEISKEKQEVQEMTDILDANWRSLIPLMGKLSKGDEVKPKPDDYDRALREMVFEPRGAVSDRLKSEEEVLKEEKERLERLEQERKERMEGTSVENKKIKHRSADDLDDGYSYQPIQYNHDKPNGNISNDEDDDGNDEDLKAFDELNQDEEINGDEETGSGDDDEGEEEDEDDDDDDDDDSLDDLKYSSGEEENDTAKENTKSPTKQPSKNVATESVKIPKSPIATLPYTFDLPESYSDLTNLLSAHDAYNQAIIFERMLKCNHPKLVPENKGKIVKLFAFTLQYISDLFQDVTTAIVRKSFAILHQLSPHLFDLFNIDSIEMTKCFRELIIEKHTEYQENNNTQYPSLDTLIFLKLVSVFYSTSDYRHPIVTPCFVFISQMLTRCKVHSRQDIAFGLFLVSLIMEYTQLSRRFLPAAVNFLRGILFLAIRKRPIELYKDVLPFKATGDYNSLLVLNEHFNKTDSNNGVYLKSEDLSIDDGLTDDFKVRALNSTLQLIADFLQLLSTNSSVKYLAESFEHLLDRIDYDLYPNFVQKSHKKVMDIIVKLNEQKFEFPEAPLKRPKALKLLEPKFDKVYDDKRTRNPEEKPKAIRKAMVRKIKSETRGAIREIRRDNAFLANIQLKKQLHSDAERREKVKRIFSEASIQQGELNALDRKKKNL